MKGTDFFPQRQVGKFSPVSRIQGAHYSSLPSRDDSEFPSDIPKKKKKDIGTLVVRVQS